MGVGLGAGVVSVAAGGHHTCAALNTGKIQCWGLNFQGQLGDGTQTDRNRPVDVVICNEAQPPEEVLELYRAERKEPLKIGDVPKGCEVVT